MIIDACLNTSLNVRFNASLTYVISTHLSSDILFGYKGKINFVVLHIKFYHRFYSRNFCIHINALCISVSMIDLYEFGVPSKLRETSINHMKLAMATSFYQR